jgi:hypothetical protein
VTLRVIQITSRHDHTEAAARLAAAGDEPFGHCSTDDPVPHHLLVSDAAAAIGALRSEGIAAIEVEPPRPVTSDAVRWWRCWRDALPPSVYFDFRRLHHEDVRSRGSLIRVRHTGEESEIEPWRVLAEAGVDVRCESYCSLPTGPEIHVLVPDAEGAVAALERAGADVSPMDYRCPNPEHGITWWGEWKPALAHAGRVRRLILMSFASPRVEQVPGVW